MNSRERILAAFARQDVDHVPCSIYFNANMTKHGYDPSTHESRIAFQEALGVDPVVDVPSIHAPHHPEVRTRTWVGQGELLYKEYATPAGTLRVGVRLTPDWPFGQDIPFPGDDFCVSHMVEPLVKGPQDVDAYRVVTGMKPLLDDIGAIGLDCVEGFEPALSGCSNEEVQRRLGGRACLWTGVSSPGHIGNPDPGVVRAAVRNAMQTFGRRAFILGVTNSIRAHWMWENTLAMVEEWKKLR